MNTTNKVLMAPLAHADSVMDIVSHHGALLTTWISHSRANAMTISWAMIGSVWSKPIFQVLVRPSRYTYELIEREGRFAVNVLPTTMNTALQLCGSQSGRDMDKLATANLTAVCSSHGCAVIDQSIVHYECIVVHRADLNADMLADDIRKSAYPTGDVHRVYWGEIVDCRCDPTALAAASDEKRRK